MKKEYTVPQIDVIEEAFADVIAASVIGPGEILDWDDA